jgi:pimeloyl-ACP methyl ester carboxylesterase
MPPTLILLHGSNGAGAEMLPLAEAMRPHASVETPNLLGHGGRPLPQRLTVREMADDVIAYMDERNIARAFLFGYSFGGYIALYLARHYAERLLGVGTLAVKYVFDEATVKHFTYLADPERLRRPGNRRPAELIKIHYPQDWAALTILNRNLFMDLGANPVLTEEDLRAIALPALILSSDRDQIVPLRETLALGQLVGGSRIRLFGGQAHPLNVCPVGVIADAWGEWLKQVEAKPSIQ